MTRTSTILGTAARLSTPLRCTERSKGARTRVIHRWRADSCVLVASFRELGPPDLCHIIKTTGKAGAKDVSLPPSPLPYIHSRMRCASARIVPLRLRCRCILLRFLGRLPQFAHVHRRGSPLVVLRHSFVQGRVEDPGRRVLLVQCLLEGRREGRGQDSWWSRGVRD